VIAETMAVNLASRRVLEKAGLRLVRIFHQPWPYPIDGRDQGDAEYALGQTEWEQRNSSSRRVDRLPRAVDQLICVSHVTSARSPMAAIIIRRLFARLRGDLGCFP
jgi:hypothetical protein